MTKDILKILKDTGRKLYVNEAVAITCPQTTGDLEFFNLDKYISDDELEKEYQTRGLEPASILSLCLYDEKHRDELDRMKYVGTHWKDDKGKWCFAAFGRWGDGRRVDVDRSGGGWGGDWFFAGLRPPADEADKPLDLEDIFLCSKCHSMTKKLCAKCVRDDLLAIAREGEYEELRREVENYFSK